MAGVLKPFEVPGLWDQPKSKRAQHISDFAKANNCFIAEFAWRNHSSEPEEGETIADLDIYEHYMFNAVEDFIPTAEDLISSGAVLIKNAIYKVHYKSGDVCNFKKKPGAKWGCGCCKCSCANEQNTKTATFCAGFFCGCSDHSFHIRFTDENVAKQVFDLMKK